MGWTLRSLLKSCVLLSENVCTKISQRNFAYYGTFNIWFFLWRHCTFGTLRHCDDTVREAHVHIKQVRSVAHFWINEASYVAWGRKQTYCCVNCSLVAELRQCCSTVKIRVNKKGGWQPHRGFSWDPAAQRQSDEHTGGQWTSLSGATSEWAELWGETVERLFRHGLKAAPENAGQPAAPCKLQQWLDAGVMDDDSLLQHEGRVKNDGLHTKLRHHIYSGTETQAWTKRSHMLLGQTDTSSFHPLRWEKQHVVSFTG